MYSIHHSRTKYHLDGFYFFGNEECSQPIQRHHVTKTIKCFAFVSYSPQPEEMSLPVTKLIFAPTMCLPNFRFTPSGSLPSDTASDDSISHKPLITTCNLFSC